MGFSAIRRELGGEGGGSSNARFLNSLPDLPGQQRNLSDHKSELVCFCLTPQDSRQLPVRGTSFLCRGVKLLPLVEDSGEGVGQQVPGPRLAEEHSAGGQPHVDLTGEWGRGGGGGFPEV